MKILKNMKFLMEIQRKNYAKAMEIEEKSIFFIYNYQYLCCFFKFCCKTLKIRK